jgi:hypothetical protein
MELYWRAFQVERAGSSAEDCMDRFGVAANKRIYALADGASLASYSAIWAEILVRQWVKKGLPQSRWHTDPILDWLKPLQAEWDTHVPWDSLDYYPRKKARMGGQATFLGVRFRSSGPRRMKWSALAIGDTCLLHLRRGLVHGSFPLRDPGHFSNHPKLLVSVPGVLTPDMLEADGLMLTGTLGVGEYMLLCTDALAAHLLQRGKDASYMAAFSNALIYPGEEEAGENFRRWVSEQRSAGAMVNDDVTLVVIGTQPEVGGRVAS